MERVLLSVLLVLLCALAALGLWWGWKRRGRRQDFLAEPVAAPPVPGHDLTDPVTGLYVATTTAGHWQDRVVAHGLGRRATATLHLTEVGVLIDRHGDDPIFIPIRDLTAVGTAAGIAGKVMAMKDGILLITWDLGGTALDSGLRADDIAGQYAWIKAARDLITGPGADRSGPAAPVTDPATTDGASG